MFSLGHGDSKEKDTIQEIYDVINELNILPEDLIMLIIEFLPVSFPAYRQYLCLNNLNIITGDGRREDVITGLIKVYKKYGYTSFIFTNKADRYPCLKSSRILTFGRFSLDRFTHILDQNSMLSKKQRRRYVLFIDDPSPEFLSYFSLSNMIFHGGNLLLPIYISISRWKDLPVSLKVMTDCWITQEICLRGRNIRSKREIELLLSNEKYFLVQELKSYDLDSDLFWLDVDSIHDVFEWLNIKR